MTTLDATYPSLSKLVTTVLSMELETLADRAPAIDYDYFDLERLLAEVRAAQRAGFTDEHYLATLGHHEQQTRGYLATIEAYVASGVVKNPTAFLMKKLMAPRAARPRAPGSEMLDTLAECSWGLWLLDKYGNLEEEKPFPGGRGDADFYVRTEKGPLWVDCLSVAPPKEKERRPTDLSAYLASKARSKWQKKFGRRQHAASLPAAIAITLLKGQESVMPKIVFHQITGTSCDAPASLWGDCPGLHVAWFGLPPWQERPHRPELFATWTRP
jgi:hypothetical protein